MKLSKVMAILAVVFTLMAVFACKDPVGPSNPEVSTVEAVNFSPKEGEVGPGDKVTLTTNTAGAMIYYTINGTEPTKASPSFYQTGTVTVNEALTIKAFAVKSGMKDSAVSSASYTIDPKATGVVSFYSDVECTEELVTEEQARKLTVYLKSASEDVKLYYTLDGTDPTKESLLYDDGIVFDAVTEDKTTTLKAIAIPNDAEKRNSGVTSLKIVQTPSAALAFTEYYMGSKGNDKYLEITNISNAAVDLEAYTIYLEARNSSHEVGTPFVLNLSGSLAPGKSAVYYNDGGTYVITGLNSIPEYSAGIDTGWKYAVDSYNTTDNTSVTAYNGNDPILLKKGDVTVDRIGPTEVTENFASKVLLIRKPGVDPTGKYNEEEWYKIDNPSSAAYLFDAVNYYAEPTPAMGLFSLSLDGTDYYAEVEKDDEDIYLTFDFQEKIKAEDELAKLETLVASFFVFGESAVTVDGVGQVSGITDNDFSSMVEYKVSLGEKIQIYKIEVLVPDFSQTQPVRFYADSANSVRLIDEAEGYSTIYLDTVTEDASIYYTLDGSEPTESSTLYDSNTGIVFEAVTEKTNITIKAMAKSTEKTDSEVSTLVLTLNPKPLTQLIISEYYIGGGTNKYIEITNIGDSDIDLSGFTLRMLQNPGTETEGAIKDEALEGELVPGKSVVYYHSGATDRLNTLSISDEVGNADGWKQKFNTDMFSNYNGDDPILLLEGTVVIDRVGKTHPAIGYFAKNTVLIRKPDATPSNVWVEDDWYKFATIPNDLSAFDAGVYHAEEPEPGFALFGIGTNLATLDGGTQISLELPKDTALTALNPVFFAYGAEVIVGSEKQVSGVTVQDFTNPVTYSVGSKEYTVTITAAAE